MKIDMVFLQNRIGDVIAAQEVADGYLKEAFPPGSKIYFKCHNMEHPAPAKVLWARMHQCRPELRVVNLITGKSRKIHIDYVVKIDDINED